MRRPFFGLCLFDGDGLGEVAGLVYVAAAADGDVIREELQGDNLDERREQFEDGRNEDDVFDEAGKRGVAFSGDGDDAAGTRGDFLDIGEGLLVAQL